MTSLVAAGDGNVCAAVRLGAFWGAGHAAVLLAIGLRPDVHRLDGRAHRRLRLSLTPPLVEPLDRAVLIPALGLFGLTFGLWYAGV